MASTNDHLPKRIHSVSIRLDDDTRDRLRRIARKDNRTMSNLVFLIVRDWLEENDAENASTGLEQQKKR
jgi:predicted transcriptional regulator